jgi:23S rRNA (cytidine1920-2'-O)/16S rRNA (cytidine1409-2'-O)-methyltransferase
LSEPVEFVTIDASFISLKVLLPVVKNWFFPGLAFPLAAQGVVIALVKPQFEAGRQQVGRGKGVIRDPDIHRQVLMDVASHAIQQGYGVRGLVRSPLTGPKGNVEFLLWLEYPGKQIAPMEELVERVLSERT